MTNQVDTVMQSKYAPLYHHLCKRDGQEWRANFSEIEKILGFSLPKSARTYHVWWDNEKEGSHSQARSWMVAGWTAQEVNPSRGHLVFRRDGSPNYFSTKVKMIVTTTPSVEGKTIEKYLGLVWGQAEHMNDASIQMTEAATKKGADAVVGVLFKVKRTTDSSCNTNNLCGTAVKFK